MRDEVREREGEGEKGDGGSVISQVRRLLGEGEKKRARQTAGKRWWDRCADVQADAREYQKNSSSGLAPWLAESGQGMDKASGRRCYVCVYTAMYT